MKQADRFNIRPLYNVGNVKLWVSNQLFGRPDFFREEDTSIGIIDDDKLLGGVVYHDYRIRPNDDPFSIDMSIATVDKRWANRHTLRAIFAYPFIQLGLERVQIVTSAHNKGVNSLVSRLGYIHEGILRDGHPSGGDAYIWGMLKSECRWL